MTFFYVWHDSFLQVAYSCVRALKRLPKHVAFQHYFLYYYFFFLFSHDELDHSILLWAYACVCVCDTWHISICTTTHFDVWHDSSIRKYYFYVWHDSFLPWAHSCVYVARDSFRYVPRLISMCDMIFLWAHIIFMCNMTHSYRGHTHVYVSQDAFRYVSRLISMCDMTYPQEMDEFASYRMVHL